ncbi:hypothetical protein V6N13_066750 [Hibiscus sabdariffa]|uniref:Uncharacterized protein n=1 Tax=Hibiscus sabdariffa TaxID=183260 RepID=A0ABR2DRF1_9ROSI
MAAISRFLVVFLILGLSTSDASSGVEASEAFPGSSILPQHRMKLPSPPSPTMNRAVHHFPMPLPPPPAPTST